MERIPDFEACVRQTIAFVAMRLRTIRQERGLTVQAVADRCGIERSNLSRLEAGKTNMTLRTLCLLCAVLEVHIQDLLPSAPEDYPFPDIDR